VEGVIFRYDPENDSIDKLKAVPEKDILMIITGSWQGAIYYSKPGSSVPLTPHASHHFY